MILPNLLVTVLRLQIRAKRAPAPPDLGGHPSLDTRGRQLRHHEQRLPRLRHLHRPAFRGQWQLGHQCDHIDVLKASEVLNEGWH
jgi:hypothetical protein